MNCWRCGKENPEGAGKCMYCDADLRRSEPKTEAGKALRALYDRYGAEKVLGDPALIVNGVGDLMQDPKRFKSRLKSAMDAGIGKQYLEQIRTAGNPDGTFEDRVRKILTEDAELADKAIRELMTSFDEMIGWKRAEERKPAAEPVKPVPAEKRPASPVEKKEPPEKKPAERKRKPIWPWIVLCAAVILAALYFFVTGKPAPAQEPTPVPTASPTSTPTPPPTPTPTPVPLPEIEKDPEDASLMEGASHTFTAEASGGVSTLWEFISPEGRRIPCDDVQKKISGLTVSGGTGDWLTIGDVPASLDGWSIVCIYRNASGETETKAAAIHVTAKPVIVTHPERQNVFAGGELTFSAKAEGAITAEWHFISANWKEDITYSGAMEKFPGLAARGEGDTLTLRNIPKELNGWKVYCLYTNEAGSTKTKEAVIAVASLTPAPTPEPTPTPIPKPAIKKDPESVAVQEGESHTFIADASGWREATWMFVAPDGGKITYSRAEAKHSGLKISGGTGSWLRLENVPVSLDGWSVLCRFENGSGNVETKSARISVAPKPTPTPTPTPAPTPTPTPIPKPVVRKDPESVTIQEGGSHTFYTDASGWREATWMFVKPDGGKITYNRAITEFSGMTISGGSVGWLKLENVPVSLDGWSVLCRFGNESGNVETKSARISVAPKPTPTPTPKPMSTPIATPLSDPVIRVQPKNQMVMEGNRLEIEIRADDAEDYEWHFISPNGLEDFSGYRGIPDLEARFLGTDIRGEYSTLLKINNIQYGFNGWKVYCKVSNSAGYTETKKVTINVKPLTYLNPEGSYAVGDAFLFGKYEQDNVRSNGKEAIEWTVLDRQGTHLLVISRYGLVRQPYNKRKAEVTWETCTLRKWLNGTFYKDAFSSAERKRIISTRIANPDNTQYGTKGGKPSSDKIFLLSIDEANQYLPIAISYTTPLFEMKCVETAFSSAPGGKAEYNRADWWLRSPGKQNDEASICDFNGFVYSAYVDASFLTVRPALWIELAG